MPRKITKNMLANRMAKAVGIHKDFAVDYLNALDDILADEVKNHPAGVYIDNIGTFKRVVKPATRKFVPSKGEMVDVPERIAVKYKPSKTFIERIG